MEFSLASLRKSPLTTLICWFLNLAEGLRLLWHIHSCFLNFTVLLIRWPLVLPSERCSSPLLSPKDLGLACFWWPTQDSQRFFPWTWNYFVLNCIYHFPFLQFLSLTLIPRISVLFEYVSSFPSSFAGKELSNQLLNPVELSTMVLFLGKFIILRPLIEVLSLPHSNFMLLFDLKLIFSLRLEI